MQKAFSKGEPTVLVHVDFGTKFYSEELEEFRELAYTAGANPVATITATRSAPEAKFFVGTGKAEEIRLALKALGATLVLFNHALTPAQERNLERFLECRVLNRVGLILDIFALRARTFEGKLQVELAQLQHLSTRLVRGWTHLERQKGGIGLRGPGETQLESDRRLIRNRIQLIQERLEKVRGQREQGRRARRKARIPTLSLVGYTNAGKSTLFNRLTAADVYVADQLFATLDPTLRKINIPRLGNAILADTVGFIRHLPHELIDAFRATLEETQQADLIIQVHDSHDELNREHADQVNDVLAQIGADSTPRLHVFNKIDLMPNPLPHLEKDVDGRPVRVWLSAKTGAGIELLYEALYTLFSHDLVYKTFHIAVTQSSLRAYLYEVGDVLEERTDDQGTCFLSVKLPQAEYDRFLKMSQEQR